MTETIRYLVGCQGSAVLPRELESTLTSLAAAAGIVPLRILSGGQRVLEMSREAAEKLASRHADLIVEEDRELELCSPLPGLPPPIPTGPALTMKIRVLDESGAPVPGATVIAVGQQVSYRGETDLKGVAKVTVREPFLPGLIVSPCQGFWSRLVPSVTVSAQQELQVVLRKLQVTGGRSWGHEALALDRVGTVFTGKGIRMAVIDSGVAERSELKAAGGKNLLDGQDTSTWNRDEKGHGTHCAGIVAANGDYWTGVAPDAQMFSLKIYPSGRISDLLEAINWCIDNYIDVINISLGSHWPSEQVALALAEAHSRGITCVAAAGNDGGAVSYPAALPDVIAVSAIGRTGSFPDESSHTIHIGDCFSRDGRHFFATFSNWGPEITVCAPGVAIPSCVPSGYSVWDGTSQACAFVSGLAALILEAYPEIRTGDRQQSDVVRDLIRRSAVDLGLPGEMQGAGLVNAARAVGAALSRQQEPVSNSTTACRTRNRGMNTCQQPQSVSARTPTSC